MKSPTERVFAGLLLLLALQPAVSSACAHFTPEQAVRRQQQLIEHSKAEASALRDEADLVFIGKLSQLTLSREAIDQTAGHNVSIQTWGAVFEFADNIKGEHAKGQVLEFSVNKNLVYVGCGPRPFRSSLPKENGAGELYLVYARDGRILRTNHIPDDVQPLTGQEEARHLRTVAE